MGNRGNPARDAVVSGNPYRRGGKITIRKEEYIGEINLPTNGFAPINVNGVVPNMLANPGNQIMFPWLSNIAGNFQQYRFKRLVFRTLTESTTNVAGTCCMAFDTDCTDTQPSTKVDYAQFGLYTRCAPWQNQSLDCTPRDRMALGSARYVAMTGSTVQIDDPKSYYCGALYVGGNATATVSLELYVAYEVELWEPIPTGLLSSATFHKTNAGRPSYAHLVSKAAGTATAAAPLGTTGAQSTIRSTISTQASSTSFLLPEAGNYLIHAYFATGNNNIAANMTVAFGANIAAGPNVIFNNTTNTQANFNATGNIAFHLFSVTVSGYGFLAANTITVGGLTGMTGGNADIYIHALVD